MFPSTFLAFLCVGFPSEIIKTSECVLVVWISIGFSFQNTLVVTTEKEIVSLILSVKVIPTQIIGISRESGNYTETVVLWTMNERDLKKSGIPEMIGTWFQNAIEINTIQAVLGIRLSILPVRYMFISLWNT